MSLWFLKEADSALPEEVAADAYLELARQAAAGGGPDRWEAAPAAVPLEVDDGFVVAVPISGRAPLLTLEATQRIRECREHDRAAARPVYDFGDAWAE
jgi:hypothetical protein